MEREELRPLLRRKFPPHRTYLLPALHFLQEELGHLPEWALQVVAWHLRTPAQRGLRRRHQLHRTPNSGARPTPGPCLLRPQLLAWRAAGNCWLTCPVPWE